MKRLWLIGFISLMAWMPNSRADGTPDLKKTAPLQWAEWHPGVFDQAKKEGKFVILDLEAVWCHWCHVMEETTYQDPEVVKLLQSGYLTVKADQDKHLDLSNRYEDYGWPATVIFSSDGKELAKRQGYIEPKPMAELLQKILEHPEPETDEEAQAGKVKPAESALLTPAQQDQLRQEHRELYDKAAGGWGTVHKLIYPFEMEYALRGAEKGDAQEAVMASQTLDLALNLLDPVWGGFYQYSDEADWKSPHFEKIMWIQVDYMRLYSLAAGVFKKPEYLDAAKKTAAYLENFWKDPAGAFYTSQDADVNREIPGKVFYAKDDDGRRALGMPRIDQNIYSRENGWAIQGLLALYNASGEKAFLVSAQKAAEWILNNRRLPGAQGFGFRHGEKENFSGPYLDDTLSMARAFLALYASTGSREWLQKSESAALFIEKAFKNSGGGYMTSSASGGVFSDAVLQLDENIACARFANSLFHYTAKKEYRVMAEHGMRYLASPDILESDDFLSGILLADRELASEPLHVVVVGHKDDPAAQALYQEALRYPAAYKRIEWWDKREGPMPNPDVQYPELPKAAAFACAQKICSLPVFAPDRVALQIDRIRKK